MHVTPNKPIVLLPSSWLIKLISHTSFDFIQLFFLLWSLAIISWCLPQLENKHNLAVVTCVKRCITRKQLHLWSNSKWRLRIPGEVFVRPHSGIPEKPLIPLCCGIIKQWKVHYNILGCNSVLQQPPDRTSTTSLREAPCVL